MVKKAWLSLWPPPLMKLLVMQNDRLTDAEANKAELD